MRVKMKLLPLPLLLSLPALSQCLSDHEKTSILLSVFNDTSAIASLTEAYTAGPHLAGKNRSLAEYTSTQFSNYGFDTQIIPYDVYLDFPVHQALALEYANGSVHTANLEEDVLPEDPTTGSKDRISTYHGYSWSGNVTAEYVYTGYGRQTDFETLVSLGVNLTGKIALIRYGGPMRGLKVRNAEAAGMVGALLFSDPGDDGTFTIANGYAAYPDGPARNPSSVQRGSVLDFSKIGGDPTTPGYASKPGVERHSTEGFTPRIPSLPVSYREVEPFLRELDGKGLSAEEVGIEGWKGGLEVGYFTGPSEAKIRIENVMQDTITPVWDVVGVWNGSSEDVVVVGNHRDSWIVGGAADPNGGSALLVLLAKGLDALRKAGWTPTRTIILCSWDAEEPGLVGSTEFVEEFLPSLSSNALTYLNLDLAVSGPQLSLRADPLLSPLISTSLQSISSPLNGTLFAHWDQSLSVFGAQSDYVGFIHGAGIASIDIDFTNGKNDPVYHYHSDYDSMHWMETYGDPGWEFHKAAGKFLADLLLRLVDESIVPLDVGVYAQRLNEFYAALQETVANSSVPDVDTGALGAAVEAFGNAKNVLEHFAETGESQVDIDTVNEKLKAFSRPLVAQGGYEGRPFYKHVVYGPGIDTGYLGVTFPGITEAVQAGNATLAKEWVEKTAKGINEAAAVLSAGLA